jgi:predicted PurR-regulated permease PerM
MNSTQRNLLFWLIISLVIAILCFLVWKTYPFYRYILSFLFAVLAPLLISAFFAYLLYPVVEFLDQYMPRWLAILTLFFLIFSAIIFGIYRAIPLFVKQLHELINNLPKLMETYQSWTYNLYSQTANFPEALHDKMDEAFLTLEENLMNILKNLIYSLPGIANIIVIAAVIPILVFYFLKDFPKMKAAFLANVQDTNKIKFLVYLKKIDESLGGYLRGQLLVCLFVGGISTLFLWFISMKYPLLLGSFMGITNIIPYFGPIIGAIPAVIIALTISTKKVILVIGAVFIIQFLESNFLSPYIVGKSLHVHPILIILALLIGAEGFGILGMILAVPILTILKVFIENTYFVRKMKRAWNKHIE